MNTNSEFLTPLSEAFKDAFEEITQNNSSDSIRHVNESVFRYILIKNLLKKNDLSFSVEDEWKRIDIYLIGKKSNAAVEIKFYDSRPLKNEHGDVIYYKGSASAKNLEEFKSSLEKLRERMDDKDKKFGNITEIYYILVGTKRGIRNNRHDFQERYMPSEDFLNTYNLKLLCNAEDRLESKAENDVLTIFGWICAA